MIDGQGGGIGRSIVEKLRGSSRDLYILALGTNPLATSLMLRAGATEGASGENAVVFNAPRMDVIVGAIGILAGNSMLGELTPAMAAAVAASPAEKILVPLQRCGLCVAGVEPKPLEQYIDDAVRSVCRLTGTGR